MARAMKDSGIEWIGEIPEGWETLKVKYSSWLKGRIGWQGLTSAEYIDDGPYLVTGTDFSSGVINWSSCVHISKERYDMDSDIQIKEGDLLISKDGTVGKVAIARDCPNEVSLNSGILLIRNIGEYRYFDKYLYYVLLSDVFWRWYTLSQTGQSTIKHLYQEQFYNFEYPFPSFEEQLRIAYFLDAECARIDAVIEQTRASIEEYKKLKQSVITQAVTKGIRPGRKMKDSGVEWIDVIPAEWSMERGKGLFVEVDNRSLDGSEELLTVSQYTGVTPRSQKNVNMFEAETLEGYKICEVGDIAANTMWLWAGAIGVSNYRGVISPSYNIYRQKNNDFDPTYLDFLLRAVPLVQHYESLSTGIRASRLRLYPQQFLSIRYPVPPMNEQKEIVSFLREKIDGMDSLIQKKEQYLAEIESYKKSLIFEYVTGKKEV